MADNTDTTRDVQNSERLLDLSNQIIDSFNERKKLLKGINTEEQLFYATVKQQQRLSQDISANAEKYLGYQIKSKDLSKQIKSAEDNKNKSIQSYSKIQDNLTKQYQNTIKANSKILQQLSAEKELNILVNAEIDRTKKIYQDLINAEERGEAVSSAKIKYAKEAYLNSLEEAKVSEDVIKGLTKQNQQHEGIASSLADIISKQAKSKAQQEAELAFLKKNLEIRKRIEKSTGLLGGFTKSLSKIPGIGTYLRADEAIDEMEKLAAKIEEAGGKSTSFTNRLQIGLKGVSVLAKGFIENITSPEAIFTFLGKAINKADQQATALGKSFGVSKSQARALREEFVKYSANANDTFVTTDRLVKAQAELSEQLGIAVQFSGEELTTFSKLTEIVGLSAQEAGKLATFSAAAGMGTKDYVKQIRLSSFAAQQTNKVHFSDKQILQDISKLSAGILVKFQNNPKALVEANIQAKKLGLSLEQVDKVGESLLNFETSIENELKAELLTGKQINLEKARYLALTGSQAELSKEIAEQAGSLSEFEEMNVLAQKSLAEAFGMSRDELADMLMKQEAIVNYGGKAAELNKEQLDYMKKHNLSADQMLDKVNNQRSAQEKFNDAVDKVKDLIGNIVAGPLGGFIDSLSNGLGYITKIFGVFGKIGSAIKGFFGDKIGGAMGEIASIATISVLIGLVAKSMMKGTFFNPMIVKDVSVGGKGKLMDNLLGDKVGGQFKKGGGRYAKGARSGGLLKGAGKLGGGLSLLSAGADLATNLTDPKRSTGNALGKTLDQNKFTALGAGIGALFGGVGALPGAAIGGILDAMLGDATQMVEDGISPSSKGPFTITDKFGATAITAKGDSLAVSPNVNNSPIPISQPVPQNAVKETIIQQRAPMANYGITKEDMKTIVSDLLTGILNKSQPAPTFVFEGDGAQLGKFIGRQMETGTSQLMNTSYEIA